MKTIQEQIEIMTHFKNGGEIEFSHGDDWELISEPQWNWSEYDYRIKEQKKTITIEKWLVHNKLYNTYSTTESDKIDLLISNPFEKVKLLDSYQVEL